MLILKPFPLLQVEMSYTTFLCLVISHQTRTPEAYIQLLFASNLPCRCSFLFDLAVPFLVVFMY